MKILQVLPALNSGGVERGTLEFAAQLHQQGHDSWVMSNGGRQLPQLLAQGSHHIQLPVHKKSLFSLMAVPRVRKAILELQPDIIHVRSRLPAWLIHLALRPLAKEQRPLVVSTFHGTYSVNAYSQIMCRAEGIIAISETVRHYICHNYGLAKADIRLIHRGVDRQQFYPGANTLSWQAQFFQQYPQLATGFILMPGRLSPWKGQAQFLQLMAKLAVCQPELKGVIVGDAEANKTRYWQQLQEQCQALGLSERVFFLGHRNDMAELYGQASLVCHLSTKAEPFGRTLTEALACNTQVVAYARGGAKESLELCFPDGMVEPDDLDAFAKRVQQLLAQPGQIHIPASLELPFQAEQTLDLYRQLLARRSA